MKTSRQNGNVSMQSQLTQYTNDAEFDSNVWAAVAHKHFFHTNFDN